MAPIRASRPLRGPSTITGRRLPRSGWSARSLARDPRPGRTCGPGDDARTAQAGNLTLRKLPKGERASLYTLLVAGHVLLTLREPLAVMEGTNAAGVIALRRGGSAAYGGA